METVHEPAIVEMAQEIKEAVRSGRLFLVDGYPREAFIHAAWEGIATFHVDLATWGESLRVRQFELEKDARLELLTDEEKEQAVKLANDWLDDNFLK